MRIRQVLQEWFGRHPTDFSIDRPCTVRIVRREPEGNTVVQEALVKVRDIDAKGRLFIEESEIQMGTPLW